LEALEETSPLFLFYEQFVQVLEKFSRVERGPSTSLDGSLRAFLSALLEGSADTVELSGRFLDRLNRYFPDAELYLFLLGNQKIYRIASKNGETEQEEASKPYPFSILTDFSGRAYQEGVPVLTNDFRSDPNLGQFLSRDNPNLPIYGAVFPLKAQEQVRGFLWIRDSAQTLEYLNSEIEPFVQIINLLSTQLVNTTPNLTLPNPQPVSIYPYFEIHSKYLYELSKIQRVPFSMILLYTKWFQDSEEHSAFILEQIRNKVSAPAIYTREDQLYYVAVLAQDRKSIMLSAAKLLDRLVRYASIEHGDSPIGEVNLGIFLETITEEGPGFRECLKQAHDLLKESISKGSNQLRISPEPGEEHEQEA
jgi:hypothetical protein